MSHPISSIEHWHEQSFTWLKWRRGDLKSLCVQNNVCHITLCRARIRKYAIAWCKADHLPCRPKAGEVAVMFRRGDTTWWTHFWRNEFEICFPEVNLETGRDRLLHTV